MRLPDDLRDFHAEPDAFQIIEESAAGLILLVLAVLCLIFWPYIS